MSRQSVLHEWYRFLDAHDNDEAVCELRRLMTQLGSVARELEAAAKPLAYSPEGDVDQALRVSQTTLVEAIEMLMQLIAQFRAGEHQVA